MPVYHVVVRRTIKQSMLSQIEVFETSAFDREGAIRMVLNELGSQYHVIHAVMHKQTDEAPVAVPYLTKS